MRQLCLPSDLPWFRRSWSTRGGWVARTKGWQRFNTLSFLAMAWDVKVFLSSFLFLFILLCTSNLASAMPHTELTKAEPLAFPCSLENAFETATNFSSYLHRFPPTATSAGGREKCLRSLCIISREAVRHGWDSTEQRWQPYATQLAVLRVGGQLHWVLTGCRQRGWDCYRTTKYVSLDSLSRPAQHGDGCGFTGSMPLSPAMPTCWRHHLSSTAGGQPTTNKSSRSADTAIEGALQRHVLPPSSRHLV